MRLGALEFSFYPTQTALENYPLPHRINSLWVIVLIQFGSVLTVEESDPLTIHLGVPRLKVNGTFFFLNSTRAEFFSLRLWGLLRSQLLSVIPLAFPGEADAVVSFFLEIHTPSIG